MLQAERETHRETRKSVEVIQGLAVVLAVLAGVLA
jgi:hypothetical protein